MSGASLTLESRLDLTGAKALSAAILEHRGKDLVIDAQAVNHLGAMALQVLRAAAQSWADSGHQFSFQNASTDCADQLSLFGFSPDTVTRWEGDR